jgi:tetratricopeptide (TPR) repeat protein
MAEQNARDGGTRHSKRRIAAMLCGMAVVLAGCSDGPDDATPQELIDSGWRSYRLGEFKSAIIAFERALEQLPGDAPLCPQALFGLGTSWNLRLPAADQDKDAAAQYYDEIITSHPGSDLAPWCALALARMTHLVPVGDEPDYDAVRNAYRTRVMEPHAGHAAAEEAALYYYSTYIATMAPADARIARDGLEAVIKSSPDSGFRSAAHALAALACETLDDADGRLQHQQQALDTMERDPRNPFYDYAFRYWKLAATAEFEVGDFATARRFYKKLIEEYPQDIRVYAARRALERMDQIEAELLTELKGGGA